MISLQNVFSLGTYRNGVKNIMVEAMKNGPKRTGAMTIRELQKNVISYPCQ